MHNRVGPHVESREIALTDGLVLAPLVALIIAFAFYPQVALSKSEGAVKASIAQAKALTQPAKEAAR
jgi:NADH:ubiquinone oxidoreductase subunit 4 (subunit M)